MGYKEAIASKMGDGEHRAAERQALWSTITESFEKEGPEGAAQELKSQMADVEKAFNRVLTQLESML